jgi:23S rRNA pseudouridine2605 synthase
LTAEQLQTVRAERWRHIANPLLTADDARAWLDAAGLCLFLPRRQQFLAPAPSFVEACAGAPSETPSREAIDNAAGLMRRLVAEGAVIPLNLFGTPSETPDFLATPESFPYLFSLRGTRDWKTVPGGKTTPLVIEIWKQLEKEGTLTAVEIQSALGRELTEAAAVRGLMELWGNLRVLPEYESAAPTRWSLTQFKFKDALTAAGRLSQTTALSALVSLYLESVLAASSEEIETFLSPLTSRSRVRETVNGLAATRQLSMIPVGTQSMFHIAGALPEFAEPEVAPEAAGAEGSAVERKPRQAARAPRSFDREGKPAERKPFERKPFERKTGERKAGERKSFGRKAFERGAAAPGKGDGERQPWVRKAEGESGERKPFGKRPAFGKKPFDKTARPFRRDAKPFDGERAAGGERRSFRPAGGGAGRGASGGKFPPKRFGFKPGGGKPEGRGDRPWTPRPPSGAEGEQRPAAGREARPFRPRREASGDRPANFRPREGGAEKRSGGFASKARFSGGKKFEGSGKPKFGGAKSGAPKFGGSKAGGSKFGARGKAPDGEKRPFFRKRPEQGATGSAGESRPRPFSRPPFGGSKPGGARSGGARPGGRPGFSGRSAGASGRAGFAKPRFSKPAGEGAERPTSSRPSSSRPSFGKSAKPGFDKGSFSKGRPSGGAGKKFGGGSKFGGKPGGAGKKFGGPKKFGGAGSGPRNFAPRKPGGAKPPFRKRKDEGSKSAE